MIKKFFLKSCVFAILFSSLSGSLYADHYEMNHVKKHKAKKHQKVHYKKTVKHIKKYDYTNYENLNKCKKYYMGFGFGIGFAGNSNNDITFDSIEADLFTPEANDTFTSVQYLGKHDYSFNPSLSFGYWAKEHVAIGVDLDYLSSREKQSGFEDSGFIYTQLASASLVGQFFFNVKNMISPYVQLGVGVGRAMIDGVIVNPDAAELSPFVGDSGLFFSDLTKNVGLVKFGVGLSKECKNSVIGLGYQFVKTTNISDSGDSVSVKFADGQLINTENFKFTNISKPHHSVNLFVKASF